MVHQGVWKDTPKREEKERKSKKVGPGRGNPRKGEKILED